MDAKKLNVIQVNLAVLMWGGTAMFAKGITLPAIHITCLRSFVAAAVLFLMMFYLKIPIKMKQSRDYLIMLSLGILMGMHWWTYFEALKVSTAAVAIIALHIYPVLTALAEPLFFKEKFKLQDIFIAILVFIGLLIMTPEFKLENDITKGIIFGVISGVFFTGRNLITRKYVQEYSSYNLMFWQTLIIGFMFLPALYMMKPPENYHQQNIILLLILGVCFTAVPHTLFSAGFKHLSAKTVSIFGMLLPFYAAFFGYLIHEETVNWRTAIGGLIIIVCVVYETMASLKKGAKA